MYTFLCISAHNLERMLWLVGKGCEKDLAPLCRIAKCKHVKKNDWFESRNETLQGVVSTLLKFHFFCA